MFNATLHRAFNTIVKTQVWIALCGWATASASFCIVEGKLLPWNWGLLLFSVILCSYNIYYRKNPDYPYANKIAVIGGLLSLFTYWYLNFPKPVFTLAIVVLSLFYMIPLKKKNRTRILLRWGLLTIVWTLATFYWPITHVPATLNMALFYCYRVLFIGNLCFFFVVKDDAHYFTPELISFSKNLLVWAQGFAIIGLLRLFPMPLGILLICIYIVMILFYKRQTPQRGLLFYSLGIDGLLILESIFVQSLFLYGLGRFSTL